MLELEPHVLLTSFEPLLTSGNEEAAVEAAQALSNLLRGGTLLHAAVSLTPAGAIVLAALIALLDHPTWEVVASVAGSLVNLAGNAVGAEAFLQVRSGVYCLVSMLIIKNPCHLFLDAVKGDVQRGR